MPTPFGLFGRLFTALPLGLVNTTGSPTTGSRIGGGFCQTTSATVVVAQGGTSPYTYAWTRLTGSNLITANSPTSATTFFSATKPTPGSIAATFRCRVTDNVAATFDITLIVQLLFESPA